MNKGTQRSTKFWKDKSTEKGSAGNRDFAKVAMRENKFKQ